MTPVRCDLSCDCRTSPHYEHSEIDVRLRVDEQVGLVGTPRPEREFKLPVQPAVLEVRGISELGKLRHSCIGVTGQVIHSRSLLQV